MNRLLLIATLVALTACGDDDTGDTTVDMGWLPDMMPVDMNAPMDDLAMPTDMPLAPSCEGEDALEPIPDSGFLVLSTDYASTAIGVVSADGASVETMRWVDSGTAAPGLVAALSGDVVLPTRQPSLGAAIIDRANDTVTRFCGSGALVGQVRVGTDTVHANPQDVLFVDAEAWVSRYEPHPDAEDEADRGSDLLGLDADAMTRNGVRVDLSAFGGTATGLDMMGMSADVEVAARPQSVVRVGDHAVVGLDRIPAMLFGGPRGHLPGAVAIVTLETGEATLHELSDLANCGRVTPVPGDGSQVLVACSGYSDVGFGDVAGERATAGLARLTLDASGVVSDETIWRVSSELTHLAAVENTIALDADRVLGVAWGEFGVSGDSLVITDLDGGEQTVVETASEAFAIGEPARLGSVVLVPDASSDGPAVWRFENGADALTPMGELTVDPALPPRQIRAY